MLSDKHTSLNTVTGTLFPLHRDPRETPIYSVAEAAAYVGVARGTLRHWIKPPTNGGRAVIEVSTEGQLSFYNLLEAHVLRVVTKRTTWLRRVRLGVEQLRREAPEDPHPLLNRDLRTASGYRNLYIRTVTGAVENLSFGGQYEFRQLLANHLRRIESDASGPYRLRPYHYQHVAIDHRVSGGRPVVRGTGILVEFIARRLRAGERPESLARDYKINVADVIEARRYCA
jgi:uncharacterized protein (DUF433 family)